MILPFIMGLIGGSQSASCLSALEEWGSAGCLVSGVIFNTNSDCKDVNWLKKKRAH